LTDSLFSELKRRNVIKVGVGYLVLAWLVVQVTATAVPALNMPDWVNTVVFYFGLIGFPFALFFAWAFEITPEGVKRESEVTRDESSTQHTGQKLGFIIITMLVIGMAYFIWESRFQTEVTLDKTADSTLDKITENETVKPLIKSVAVLPFASFSADAEQGWFADGLTEELLNALARTQDLLVSSRTSSFSYKNTDKDIRTIAKELGVEHILEGSVRRGGDRIRVTAQLIRANDGFHLWSQTYDSDYKDIIEIQEDVAISIANALETVMDPEALAEMIAIGTSSIEAYDAFLEAKVVAYNTMSFPLEEIITLLERAIKIDPHFARALASLSAVWFSSLDVSTVGNQVGISPLERHAFAVQYAKRAISEFGEGLDAQFHRGLIAQYELRFKDAELIYETILKANPSYKDAHFRILELKIKMGYRSDADKLNRAATELFPHDKIYHINQITNFVWILDSRSAALAADIALEQLPRDSGLAYQSHRAYLMNGEIEKAAKAMQVVQGSASLKNNKLMVQLRQACRTNDYKTANEIYLTATKSSDTAVTILWLMSMTLGNNQQAHEYIKHLDQSDRLIELSSFLYYYHFELDRYPNLKAVLEDQGIKRPATQPIIIGCKSNPSNNIEVTKQDDLDN